MRTDRLVVAAPILDDDPAFRSAPKPLDVQVLVAKATVEALVRSVLPRLSWRDIGRFNVRLGQPLHDSYGHEFGPIVRPQVPWRTMDADETSQDIDDLAQTNRTVDLDCQGLVGELIDDLGTSVSAR